MILFWVFKEYPDAPHRSSLIKGYDLLQWFCLR